jgi:hypothetical protein
MAFFKIQKQIKLIQIYIYSTIQIPSYPTAAAAARHRTAPPAHCRRLAAAPLSHVVAFMPLFVAAAVLSMHGCRLHTVQHGSRCGVAWRLSSHSFAQCCTVVVFAALHSSRLRAVLHGGRLLTLTSPILAALGRKKDQGIGSNVESEDKDNEDTTGIPFSSSSVIFTFSLLPITKHCFRLGPWPL